MRWSQASEVERWRRERSEALASVKSWRDKAEALGGEAGKLRERLEERTRARDAALAAAQAHSAQARCDVDTCAWPLHIDNDPLTACAGGGAQGVAGRGGGGGQGRGGGAGSRLCRLRQAGGSGAARRRGGPRQEHAARLCAGEDGMGVNS